MTQTSWIEALTPREQHYRTHPDDLGDIPFRYRTLVGRRYPYLPLGTDTIFANGSTPTFSIKRHSRFQRFPAHCHDGIELNYLYAGTCHQVVNGIPLDLTAGQTLLLSPDTVHRIDPLGPHDILLNVNLNSDYLVSGILTRLSCESIVTRILVDTLATSLGDTQRRDTYLAFPSEGNAHLRPYFEHLLEEWHRPSAMAREILESLLVLIIAELVNVYRERGSLGAPNPVGPVLPLLRYVEEHYAEASLEATAAHVHLNPTYLSALLKERIGLSFRELVLHLRLDAAERLLTTTDLSVTEIARRVGYENVSFFYRKFRARNGCKPGEFRCRHRTSTAQSR